MKDLFSGLLEFVWRDVPFLCGGFEVDVSQDLVEHKWPDRDGAHVESTGRNPLVFTAKALFRNGAKPAQSEHHIVQSQQYPRNYRTFLTACADRSAGTLQHPELGDLLVKCKSAKTHWDPNRRDGVDVDVVWIETTETLDNVLSNPSPIAEAGAAAGELDDALLDYNHANDTGLAPGLQPMSFSQLMNSITSVFDRATLLQKQLAGKVDEIAYRVNTLLDAVDRTGDVQHWPIIFAAERLKASLTRIKKDLLIDSRPVYDFIVGKDSTLAAISADRGASLADVIKLNRGTISGPIVSRGTILRFFR